VAAKLAVQTFAAEPPADDAMNVKAPAGGWDRAVSTAPAKPATPAKTQAAVVLRRPSGGLPQPVPHHGENATAFTLAAAV
jgi:hypothetical protein